MKKLLVTLLALTMTASAVFAFGSKPKQILDVVPLMSSETEQANRVWVGTFQLVWNDLMAGIVKGPVKFVGDKSELAKQLNKQKFKTSDLSEDSYYTAYGETSPELKTQIEAAIKEKFNETSDVLNNIDWTPGPQKYVLYAMLKKDFKFLTAFDKLGAEKFGKNRTKVQYFGIGKDSDSMLDKTVYVLFYNSSKDYAVSIQTQGKDVLYLYRTKDDKPFDKLYSDMMMKKAQYDGVTEFLKADELKVPDISLYREKSFAELCDKEIKGTKGMMIDQALETVDFKMNNEGVKLKSEAAIATKMSMPLIPAKMKSRKFYFNDTFVMFLQEYDKNKPYFALRVQDVSLINKTGRN